ncbi:MULTISPECIES: hypothetical protein [unclassified Microcoleus]|uniref:hypothetical protein n=1 Tax=unclassified Microcoleus TaxID=2642155 RepID=UPI002FD6DAAB
MARGSFFREISGSAQRIVCFACDSLSTPREAAFLLGFTLRAAQWGEVKLAELTELCFQGRSKIEGTYVEGIWG